MESVPLIQLGLTQEVLLGMSMLRESVQALASSSASTSIQAITPSTEGFFIKEPLIVGQEEAFAVLEKLWWKQRKRVTISSINWKYRSCNGV